MSAVLAFSLFGCEGVDNDECQPRQIQACPCGGDQPMGTQECAEDGSGWGECKCGGGDTDADTDSDTDSDTDTDADTDADTDSDSDADSDADTDTDSDSDTDTDKCGNGELDPGEQCEAGQLQGETCGDHDFEDGEVACTEDCTFDISGCYTCGDSQVTGPEVCDDGVNDNTYDNCPPDCMAMPDEYCGDGVINGQETCDDGDLDGEDECPSGPGNSCRPSTCGDEDSAFRGEMCWTHQNPQPQGDELNDIQFVNHLVGWAVGDHGTVLHTEDGGLTWTDESLPTDYDLKTLSFLDADTGWVIGDWYTLLSTNDGGLTWHDRTPDVQGYLVGVQFADELHGWLLGQDYVVSGGYFQESFGLVYRTTDGGTTWQRVEVRSRYSDFWVQKIHFVDDLHGWLIARWWQAPIEPPLPGPSPEPAMSPDPFLGRAVYGTADGGATWDLLLQESTVDYGFMEYRYHDIQFVDPDHGWLAGGQLMHSADGGQTWEEQETGELDVFRAVHFIDRTTGWATGAICTIVRTEDGGGSWEAQTPEDTGRSIPYDSDDFNAVFFADSEHGWVAGSRGHLELTADGGSTWSAASSGYEPWVRDFHFVDDYTGWAVGLGWADGHDALVLHTVDGGVTWHRQEISAERQLMSVHFVDHEHGWTAGDEPAIYRTTDGGTTWSRQDIDSVDDNFIGFRSLWFTDELNGWGAGRPLHRTRDGGETWQPVETVGSSEYVQFVDAKTGWASGYDSLFRTEDGGDSWEQISRPDRANRFHFINSTHGWATGSYDGVVLSTQDGGSSWELLFEDKAMFQYMQAEAIFFLDRSNGWIVGGRMDDESASLLLHTHDGGRTWEAQNPGTSEWLWDIQFTSPDHGWAAGRAGTIIHTTTLGR